ncbi:hypothetical protein EWI61_03485 [Methylolobus aquaticus]|nr:hypothetical protein EWI61_03485 [Methylolobus aquaticus]
MVESGVVLNEWEILAWVVAGGALGGIVDVCSRLEYTIDGFKDSDIPVTRLWTCTSFILSIIVGGGGALALQWVLLGIGKFDSASTPENKIFFLAISVMGGFGARRLLPGLRQALEEQVLQNRRDVEEVRQENKRDVEEIRQVADTALERASETDSITRALSSFAKEVPLSVAHESISELQELLEKQPTHRRAAIIRARLFRHCNDIGSAIKVLDTFVRAKELEGEADKDLADALYNRACYNALLYATCRKKEYFDLARNDLERSIELSAPNRFDAERDPDLAAVVGCGDWFASLGTESTDDVAIPEGGTRPSLAAPT